MGRFVDLTGKRFGRWTVIGRAESRMSALSKYYWQIGKDGYPVSCINKKFKKFHVLILDCPKGFERDHINGNRTDNRRENLRVIPASANRFNKGMNSRNKSGHTGVFWYERYKNIKFQLKREGKPFILGIMRTMMKLSG